MHTIERLYSEFIVMFKTDYTTRLSSCLIKKERLERSVLKGNG